MSVKELKLDCLGGKLYVSKFADKIVITPIVEKNGDAMELNRSQAHFLVLLLQEYLRSNISKGLNDAVSEELAHPPASIVE